SVTPSKVLGYASTGKAAPRAVPATSHTDTAIPVSTTSKTRYGESTASSDAMGATSTPLTRAGRRVHFPKRCKE
ncbi:hypothetical protein AVEN_27064-1, partial [Araneus ventricosus]